MGRGEDITWMKCKSCSTWEGAEPPQHLKTNSYRATYSHNEAAKQNHKEIPSMLQELQRRRLNGANRRKRKSKFSFEAQQLHKMKLGINIEPRLKLMQELFKNHARKILVNELQTKTPKRNEIDEAKDDRANQASLGKERKYDWQEEDCIQTLIRMILKGMSNYAENEASGWKDE
ncbi:hypothetical protein Tco_0477634 [Tanacetum coccineum]